MQQRSAAESTDIDVGKQLNIRDLSQALPTIAKGKVFRTSCLLVNDDRKEIAKEALEDYDIRVLLDLRSLDEMTKDVASEFSTRTFTRDSPPPLPEQGASTKVRYVVQLLERENLYRGVLERLSATDKAAMLWYSLVSYRKEQEIFLREINRGALRGLNVLMLDQCGPEIAYALQVVTCSAEAAHVCAFQCKLGKDRTGLIGALVLMACGAEEEAVIRDYERSNGIDEIALGPLTAREEDAKRRVPDPPARLDRSRFVGAERSTMEGTLLHLREQYGGIEAYLDRIGFDETWRGRLQAAVMKP